MRKILAIIVVLFAPLVISKDISYAQSASVKVFLRQAEESTYLYKIINLGSKPITKFKLGYNRYKKGAEEELSLAPAMIGSPTGWDGKAIFLEESNFLHISWKATDFSKIVLSEAFLDGFQVYMPQTYDQLTHSTFTVLMDDGTWISGKVSESAIVDADGDGYSTSDSFMLPGDDCNDSNTNIYPNSQEICNDNLDNDCDGEKDEGCCTDSDGDGYKAISAACQQGLDCNDSDPAIKPGAAEICDGKDNNCDGNVDEDVAPAACYSGPEGTLNVGGLCKEGTKTCTSGTWSECAGEVLPAAEVCDGENNDCDRQIDENLSKECYTGPAGTKDVGLCKAGEQACSAGQWGACTGEVLPAAEVCDGEDGNCDGVKEDFTVSIEPSSVKPKLPGGTDSDTKATLTASLGSPAPQGGCGIKFNVEPVEDSGGHKHSNNNPIRPRGSVSPNPANIGEGDTSVTAVYSSNEISGKEAIELKLGDKVIAEPKIDVQVPGLASLAEGTNYVLVGAPNSNDPCRSVPATSKHNNNHSGTSGMTKAVRNIADAYASVYPGVKLRINDMSLPGGGAFDVGNRWLEDTTVPQCRQRGHGHCTHRLGTNADIGFVGLNASGQCVNLDKQNLYGIIRDATDKDPHVHSDHYHISAPR